MYEDVLFVCRYGKYLGRGYEIEHELSKSVDKNVSNSVQLVNIGGNESYLVVAKYIGCCCPDI